MRDELRRESFSWVADPEGRANLLFVGTYIAARSRRDLLAERKWNLLFTASAAVSVAFMLGSIPVLAIQSGGLSVAMWGTPFESQRWPGQLDLFGDGVIVFSVGHVVWTAAGVILLVAVRRMRDDSAVVVASPAVVDDQADSPFAPAVGSAKPRSTRTQSVGTGIGIVPASLTVLLAVFSYFVHFQIEMDGGLIRRHGRLDEFSQWTFLLSFLTALLGLRSCLAGLPRRTAVIGGLLVLLTWACYFVVTPFRVYFP